MNPLVYVGIAEYKILDRPGLLACSALGSCVGVCLWDPDTKLAGLLHILLPTVKSSNLKDNPAKFADRGIEQLVLEMERRGATRRRLRAKLVGGACLYHYEGNCAATEIGDRNVAASRAALRSLGIPVLAEHVGGKFGRSIRFDRDNFEIRVTVLTHGVSVI